MGENTEENSIADEFKNIRETESHIKFITMGNVQELLIQ